MPGYSRLSRRGTTYYFRVGVPEELRSAIGKREILRSLRTSDFREAKRLVAFESADADALFLKERQKLKRVSALPTPLPRMTDAERHHLVLDWFIGEEKRSLEWWQQTGRFLDESKADDAVENLNVDEAALSGSGRSYEPDDGSVYLDGFLAEKGLICTKESAEYRQLAEVFRLGRLEILRRLKDRIERRPVGAREPLFRDVFAYTPVPPSLTPAMTLGELLDQFLKFTKAHRSETTFISYQTPARVIRDVLGEKTPLPAISRADIERFGEVLKKLPQNAQQRYPGLTAEQAVAAAERKGDERRLGPKTLESYFVNTLAVFNYAVEEKFMAENPASYRSFREAFRAKETRRKALFTLDELNAIFSAPLYTGCANDETSFSRPGPNVIRRGRFWVPLIALFQGARLNEACQLYTEDVRDRDGIQYLAIREDLDADDSSEKRLKNAASQRDVPIHPKLIEFGFSEFVASRRKDTASPRLFPELPAGMSGRYSNPFSKYFSGFLVSAIGYKPKATFHSFRHHFRDALRAARIGDENVEALGGWAGEGKQQRKYGTGPSLPMLLADLAKVEYPGLDLAHLARRI